MRHLPVDVGLLSPGRRLLAHGLFVQPPEPGTLTLFGRALAFVRAPLPLVRLTLAVVGDSISLVGELISSTRQKLAPSNFGLALFERLLALIERLGLAFEFPGSFGAVLNGHELNHSAATTPRARMRGAHQPRRSHHFRFRRHVVIQICYVPTRFRT